MRFSALHIQCACYLAFSYLAGQLHRPVQFFIEHQGLVYVGHKSKMNVSFHYLSISDSLTTIYKYQPTFNNFASMTVVNFEGL